jgi:hypothetical protein
LSNPKDCFLSLLSGRAKAAWRVKGKGLSVALYIDQEEGRGKLMPDPAEDYAWYPYYGPGLIDEQVISGIVSMHYAQTGESVSAICVHLDDITPGLREQLRLVDLDSPPAIRCNCLEGNPFVPIKSSEDVPAQSVGIINSLDTSVT